MVREALMYEWWIGGGWWEKVVRCSCAAVVRGCTEDVWLAVVVFVVGWGE